MARSRGYCFVWGLGLLLAVASLVEHKLWGSLASVIAAQVLSSCSSRALEPGLRSCGAEAQLPSSMWYLPGAGFKPMYPELVGGFLTIGATRKAQKEEF